MPEVEIHIGGRSFEVACQEGEQDYLTSAAKMLDDEAQVLVSQIGHITEPRMLLMAGLMLADKTAGVEDRLRELEAKLAETEGMLQSLQSAEPEKVEVAVIPNEVSDTLAELAARAEALAAEVEDKAS
ncbi:cell division protein ZapA [uncultured Shimia sp.]|uniref:cell division protein ZapA n=1 Tax=uncultured Shimia sp. TaxID=573152 RepID=UPI002636ECEE|nr:cell division protein ZapA [uncultured Shimia sp.]